MRQAGRKLLQRVLRYEGRWDKKLFTNAVPRSRIFFRPLAQAPSGLSPTGGCELAISMKGLGEATVKDASLPQRQSVARKGMRSSQDEKLGHLAKLILH